QPMAGSIAEGIRRAVREMTARMVRDSRGRRCRLLEPNGVRWMSASLREIPKKTLEEIRQGIRARVAPHPWHWTILMGVLGFALLLNGSIGWSALRAGQGWGIPALGASGVVASAYFMVQVLRGQYRTKTAHAPAAVVVEAMLAARHCPSCGHSLSDLVAAPDGCTVCPECGSAWIVQMSESVQP
ncbi:MAG TPA: hypothetical protein VG797_02865, partial [Phycisphaerales bacterium]|nr:hypothetical protein [Phycisphaerales bacterium]